MQRICKYCGCIYAGKPGSSACPDCVKNLRSTSLSVRVCKECGISFIGGPAAKYCPICRQQRKAIANRQCKRNGSKRPLGSIDLCEVCRQPYTVTGPRQKYCPDCADAAIRDNDRQKSREWNAANTTPGGRRQLRQAHAAEISCAVCGKPFVPHDTSITCSPACSVELHKQRTAAWEREHRSERNRYHYTRIKAAESAMSPEDYQAHRAKINARARENYRKRKGKQ